MFETSCRPYMAQSPTISRKLPQTLRQWARFVSWPFVFNSCLSYLVIYLFCQSTCGSMPRCLKQLVLVHMSFPDILPPFASAGCVVTKGFLGTWHWVRASKKPKSPKSARSQRLRIPRNEYLFFWGYGVTYVAFGGSWSSCDPVFAR